MHRAGVAAVLGLLLIAATACQDAEPPPADPRIDYVALGDSYVAAPHTPADDLSLPCFRSDDNYPRQLADLLPNTTLFDVSCSGATTAAMTGEQRPGVLPQLDALSKDTDLVTITVGGNDELLFPGWLTCNQLTASDPKGSPCADSNRTAKGDVLLDKIPRIQENVSAVLAEVQERAPRATVVVVTYPQVFPDRGTCKLASTYAVGDLAYNNRLAKALSDALIAAAQEAGVRWVDVYQASQGHDVCSAEPWVNGPGAKDQSRANIMHPFPEEQAAVARLIEDKLF